MNKRAQGGSAASFVLLVVVAVMIWWQWDWISGLFGGGRSAGLVVENYRCDQGSIDGTVRNTSEEAISVRAVTAIYDSSGKKSDYRESPVRPSPIKPGQSAGFRGETGALPDGGSCRLDGFVDSDTGKHLRYSGH